MNKVADLSYVVGFDIDLVVGFLFSVSLISLLCCLFVMKRQKTNHTIELLRRMVFTSIMMVITTVVAVKSPSAFMANIFYSVTMIIYDIMIYNFADFALFYCKYIRQGRAILMWFQIFFGIDSIMLVVNMFKRNLLKMVEVTTSTGSICYGFASKPLHLIHIIIAFSVALFAELLFFVKSRHVPKFYRKSYISIFTGVMGVILITVFFLTSGSSHVDFTLFLSSFLTVVIYYFAVVFGPRDFVNRCRNTVVSQLGSILLIFDNDGDCIDINEAAEKKFGSGITSDKLKEWLFARRVHVSEEFDGDIMEAVGDVHDALVYHAHTNKVSDDKGNFLGSFVVIWDKTDEYNKMKKEMYDSTHDSLTDLFNRNTFYEEVDKTLGENMNKDYYLVCTDVENFKLVNDVFGPLVGDTILMNYAQELRGIFTHGETLGRIGNDVFGILMEKKYFDRRVLRDAISRSIDFNSELKFPLDLYIGIYEVSDLTASAASMCERALMAVKMAKSGIVEKTAFYDNEIRDSAVKEQALAQELERALEDREFVIYLQPQVDAGGKVVGGEALVRWNHPEKGILSPGIFIGIMEKNGMIARLDYLIWEMACEKLKEWETEGWKDMSISVNISPKDFYYRDIYKTFTDLIKQYDIPPSRLKLEITETAIMQNIDDQIELIKKLQQAGFTIEMDDFGSGYSSLNMLNRIHVDVLKIDMAFLNQGVADERSRQILWIMQQLSKRLGMKSIIEGVETREEVDYLKEIGCDIFQGYYFSAPISIEKFEEKYMSLSGERQQ